MKPLVLWLTLAVATVHALEPTPLPSWKPDEKKAHEQAGGIFHPLIAVEPKAESEPLEIEQPKAEELAPHPEGTVEVPKKFLPAYFAARPKTYLVDPQGLLGAKEFEERSSFLNYHAGDSSIDFYIYVFGRDQEIPGEVRAEETVERLFNSGRPAVVIFYFLGAPQRSSIHLSPSLIGGISAAEQRRALQSSVMVAFEKLDFATQLDAFAVQMSIRIYWMERMLGGAAKPEIGAGPAIKPTLEKKHTLDQIKLIANDVVKKWGDTAVLVAIVFTMIFVVMLWFRFRGGRRFPDLEVEPRLGGAHCAGIGAVISFASASVPPASQKDQVPDYLRRA